MHDVIIVGSGAAATGAALQFANCGIKVKILDAGISRISNELKINQNIYKWRGDFDAFEFHIGNDFTGLNNLIYSKNTIPKLSAPNFSYITDRSDELSPILTNNFDITQSFAFGGLANAWGAGMYRFIDQDLKGFPFDAASLDRYADQLTMHMGITGSHDDLTPYFGSSKGLLPPLHLSRNFLRLNKNYERNRNKLNSSGLWIGRPRLAVLSEPFDNRPAFNYDCTEFWQSSDSIYTPSQTLNKLINNGAIEYIPGIIVESYAEDEQGVIVNLRCIRTNTKSYLKTKKLLLAAGAIGTTKIVLNSARDYKTKLILQDNPKLQIPFILPRSLGNRLDVDSFGLTQLNLIWNSNYYNEILQGSLMELTSPLRSEFYSHFPLSSVGRMVMINNILPSMLLLQLFFPGDRFGKSEISLTSNGSLLINGIGENLGTEGISELLRGLRLLGLYSHSSFAKVSERGNSLHYACTLPMKRFPNNYECYSSGLLFNTRSVYICDSAAFSSLPAKNMSFGMMTNAMRVADELSW